MSRPLGSDDRPGPVRPEPAARHRAPDRPGFVGTIGRILGEAAIIGMGMNGASFASYGSEKKGTPVKGYIRVCEAETDVRVSTPIEEPHVLAIFHEALAKALTSMKPGAVVVTLSAGDANRVGKGLLALRAEPARKE